VSGVEIVAEELDTVELEDVVLVTGGCHASQVSQLPSLIETRVIMSHPSPPPKSGPSMAWCSMSKSKTSNSIQGRRASRF
jgi:hypothetical protein